MLFFIVSLVASPRAFDLRFISPDTRRSCKLKMNMSVSSLFHSGDVISFVSFSRYINPAAVAMSLSSQTSLQSPSSATVPLLSAPSAAASPPLSSLVTSSSSSVVPPIPPAAAPAFSVSASQLQRQQPPESEDAEEHQHICTILLFVVLYSSSFLSLCLVVGNHFGIVSVCR